MRLTARTLQRLDAIALEVGCSRTAAIDVLLERAVNGFNAGVVSAVNGKVNEIHLAMALIKKGAYLPAEVVRAAHVADEAARDVSGLVVLKAIDRDSVEY